MYINLLVINQCVNQINLILPAFPGLGGCRDAALFSGVCDIGLDR